MGAYGIWNGWWVGRYSNGNKRREGEFVDGERVGLWTSYHFDGGVSEQGVYDSGLKNGLWTEFWPGGAKRAEGEYVNGIRQGKWTEWSTCGEILFVTTFDNGRAVEKVSAEALRKSPQQQDRIKVWDLPSPKKLINRVSTLNN